MRRITVLAAVSQDQLENDGCDVEQECETIVEAKRRAKYYLTEECMKASESTTMLGYAQVRVDGVCEYDFFAKRPVGEYPEINNLTATECRAAIKLAHANHGALTPGGQAEVDRRVVAIQEQLRRLVGNDACADCGSTGHNTGSNTCSGPEEVGA